MIKLYRFHTRRPDLTHDQMVADWTGRHVPALIEALGSSLVRYATNEGLAVSWTGEPEEAPPYDGFDELWLDVPWEGDGTGRTVDMGREVRSLFEGSPEIFKSEREFAGLTVPMAAEEIVQKETGRDHTFKIVELLTRRRDQTWTQCREIWLGEHVPYVKDVWGDRIVQYTTNLGLSNPFTQRFPDEAPICDGIAEIYWGIDVPEFVEGLVETAPGMIPDETAFLGTYRGMLADEVIRHER
ncbi:MAG: hypothetical protein M3Y45_07470 [Actinomycetota bacterium]|nr:hypothetical protein [Actinomycetota bacterium]